MHRLIAVLLSDGNVDPRRNSIGFTENKALVKRLVKDFEIVEGIPLIWATVKHHNSLKARTYNKALTNRLFEVCNTFRTRPCHTHPQCSDGKTCKLCIADSGDKYPIIELDENIISTPRKKREFLKYFYSCDGGVSISAYRRKDNGKLQSSLEVKVGSTNPQIKRILSRILRSLGFSDLIMKQDGISLKTYDSFVKFRDNISFLKEASVKRGNFIGRTKNEMLDLAIKCKELSMEGYWINRLGSVEAVMNYIHSLLG